jgi:hypothetical protein
LQGRQIFKFGLLRKKDNKKNLKIRLVFNRMVVAFFPPYYSYTNPLGVMQKRATAQIAHLVFADTKANAKKPKEQFFSQR